MTTYTNEPDPTSGERLASSSATPSALDSPPKRQRTVEVGESTETQRLGVPSNISALEPGVDLARLRLDQSYPNAFGVKRQYTSIPLRKPRKDEFFRVHPDDSWAFPATTIEVERETYVLGPAIRDLFPELAKPVTFYPAVNRNGDPFLIPVPMQGLDGRRNTWSESLGGNVLAARKYWVRSAANMATSAYDQWTAERLEAVPQWPDLTVDELYKRAFIGRTVESPDHPIVRQLRGLE